MKPIRSYLVVDCETNGKPEYDKRGNTDFSKVHPVEIGVLRVVARQEGGIIEATPWSRLVKLPEGARMDPEAAEKHGITTGELEASGVDFSNAIREIEAVVESLGGSTVIIGHNLIGFDLHILRRSLAQIWYSAESIDTMLLWRAWQHGIRKAKYERLDFFWGRVYGQKFSALSSADHVEATLLLPDRVRSTRHRAIPDCQATAAILEEMVYRGIVSSVLGENWHG